QADRLVTVSENARSQIASAFGYPESAIRVITEGPSPIFQPINDASVIGDTLARYHLPAGVALILYVGGIIPHKNLQGLLQALSQMRSTCKVPWHLALVGDYANDSFLGCFQELQALSRQLQLTRQITFTGFVPDADLAALYNAATLLVLPSF